MGVQSPRDLEETNAELKLLHAIFGRGLPPDVDRSLEFSGATPGRGVLSVQVRLSRRWQGEEIRPVPGKVVVRQDDMPAGELAGIDVTLAVTQPLEVGDSLHSEGGGDAVVVCRLAGGPALARAVGLASEPDLVVAPDHPWALPGAAPHVVRVGLASNTLLALEACSRGTGPYNLITSRPISFEGERRLRRNSAPTIFTGSSTAGPAAWPSNCTARAATR